MKIRLIQMRSDQRVAHLDVDWPAVPRIGESVEQPFPDGPESPRVTHVTYRTDGSVVVELMPVGGDSDLPTGWAWLGALPRKGR